MRPPDLRDPRVYQWLARQPIDQVATSAITVAEVMYGIERLPMSEKRSALLAAADTMFTQFPDQNVIPFDADMARAFARMSAARRGRSSSILASNDLLIAGVAAVRGLIVVTRNVKDFEGLGVRILNPWEVRDK